VITEAEESTLRQFCKVVDEIHECRFMKRAQTQNHNITVDRDPSKNHIPHYDMDEFRSFATLFRKLVSNGEPAHLFRVMNIIKRYAPADVQHTFKDIKRELNREADHPFIQIAIGKPDEEVPYTPRKICDVLFNGVVFHNDLTLRDDVERVLEYQPMIMASFLRYACCVINISARYAANVEHFGYFKS
jgi:hypothetical protein